MDDSNKYLTMQRIDNKLMTSKVLRVTKISLGITTVLFAITMSYQFIKYSFTEDYRHNVDPNFEYLDNGEIEFINYDVQGEDTTALFDLEDYEVENLRLIGLCLSSLSIVYVLLTLMVKGRAHSQLDVLSQQNEVLKKQIENSELKQRLKGITVVESQPTETNQSPEVFSEVRGSNLRSCPKCSTVNEKINSFCSLCGYDFRIDLVANPAASSKKPKYSHGVKTTLIWSTLLSFATLLIYTLKGSITTNIELRT